MSPRRARVVGVVAALALSAAAPVFALAGLGGTELAGGIASRSLALLGGGAIKHVVIVYQENHSFDETLGGICAQGHRCDAATSGRLPDGGLIPLRPAPDLVPGVNHSVLAQTTAINGGEMNGFGLIAGCRQGTGYACYEQYSPQSIPNLAALANTFAISDRTFEDGPVPSWGAHLGLVAAQLDGFTGDNPTAVYGTGRSGWGCNSNKDSDWQPPSGGSLVLEPAACRSPTAPAPTARRPCGGSPRSWTGSTSPAARGRSTPPRRRAAATGGRSARRSPTASTRTRSRT